MTSPGTSTAAGATDSGARFSYVARQPILTADEKVFGYELLFRDGVENEFRETDFDSASRRTLDTSFQIGLEVLCDGHRGFVNCTRDVLLKDYMTLLPPSLGVVEVLESVPPDDLVMAALLRLRKAGYTIALDDFVFNDPRQPLAPMADILKVDLRQTTAEQRETIRKSLGTAGCRLLAEKVETREEFAAAKAAGFTYFQGYFFRRPEVLHAREIPASRLNYLRLLQAVSQPEIDVVKFEAMIKQEASICYRLLRYLNSAVFGMKNEIHSIRHALTLLGEREVRRWVRLVATLTIGESRSSELVSSAMVRARFCELLAPRVPHGESDLFLMGLFSLIDSILEIPMPRVLEAVPVDHETKAVLLGEKSKLRPLYELMLARESGDWEVANSRSRELRLSESDVAEAFWQAMHWSRQIASI
ncbi:MAG TPA: HDOD domain-containing protein [Terriglobales bacterium]|nr:HDOD domain-containing protein [Terriglobales bacterium]